MCAQCVHMQLFLKQVILCFSRTVFNEASKDYYFRNDSLKKMYLQFAYINKYRGHSLPFAYTSSIARVIWT